MLSLSLLLLDAANEPNSISLGEPWKTKSTVSLLFTLLKEMALGSAGTLKSKRLLSVWAILAQSGG